MQTLLLQKMLNRSIDQKCLLPCKHHVNRYELLYLFYIIGQLLLVA